MISKIQIVGKVGIIALVFGTILFTGGYYLDDEACDTGTALDLEEVENSSVVEGNTTNFENLSSTEQRIFLEAYTYRQDRPGASRVYADWSEEWFNGESFAPFYIAYRGEIFETSTAANDCGVPVGEIFQSLGMIVGMIGVVITIGMTISKNFLK